MPNLFNYPTHCKRAFCYSFLYLEFLPKSFIFIIVIVLLNFPFLIWTVYLYAIFFVDNEELKQQFTCCFNSIFFPLARHYVGAAVLSPSSDFTIFENNPSMFFFVCCRNGIYPYWAVDGIPIGSESVLNKGIHNTHVILKVESLGDWRIGWMNEMQGAQRCGYNGNIGKEE